MERRLLSLGTKLADRMVKTIRSGRIIEISISDILVSDVILLKPGDVIPADGESDAIKKTPADQIYKALLKRENLNKLDPFILSGATVSGGVGSFLCTCTGVHSIYGRIMMSLPVLENRAKTRLGVRLMTLAEKTARIGCCAALLLFVVLLTRYCVRLPSNRATPAEKGKEFLKIVLGSVAFLVIAVHNWFPLVLLPAFSSQQGIMEGQCFRALATSR
ncbi:hypothetical protein AJ80_05918 [Polytolypa hystricis UAMH7299]|uniref:P-type ATPase A domain-containing protein n=1 Tax=Polytolypa hystricis (strain UAMH7299) TaxID=1447883 RepID=A0A2B7Y0B3_POLH7|nr:hypothetical protein AJ80_05918 [Polytolypa hystricis UAMH7299]